MIHFGWNALRDRDGETKGLGRKEGGEKEREEEGERERGESCGGA